MSTLEVYAEKAGAKLNALSRVAKYVCLEKRRLVMNAFFSAQLRYCSLILMFRNRSLYHKINRLHERCLRIVCNDNYLSLLIQFLALEIFSVYTKSASKFLNEVFSLNPELSYSLRNQQTFATRPIHTVHYGSNMLSYLGPKIWKKVSSDIKY